MNKDNIAREAYDTMQSNLDSAIRGMDEIRYMVVTCAGRNQIIDRLEENHNTLHQIRESEDLFIRYASTELVQELERDLICAQLITEIVHKKLLYTEVPREM